MSKFVCKIHVDQSCIDADHPGLNPHALYCNDEPLVVQADKDSCDVNKIMARAKRDGILPVREGAIYGDFSSTMTYHEALDRVRRVEEHFATLNADQREFFDNDPANMVDPGDGYLNDPKNEAKAISLGLLEPKAVPAEASKAAPAAAVVPNSSPT